MPRSITGSLSRRRMTRVAVLLAAPVAAAALLSGCGAGQVSQTDKMVAAVSGAEVTSKHKVVALRDLQIKYNSPEGYQVGETAPLQVYIANNDPGKQLVLNNVTATSTTGEKIGNVVLMGGASDEKSPSSEPSASAAASSRPSASASAKSSKKASASASASASESSAPASPSASASPSAAGAAPTLKIPANGHRRLDPDQGSYLAITDIAQPLAPGSSVVLTFTFEGEDPLQVSVPFAVPLTPAPRVMPSDSANVGE